MKASHSLAGALTLIFFAGCTHVPQFHSSRRVAAEEIPTAMERFRDGHDKLLEADITCLSERGTRTYFEGLSDLRSGLDWLSDGQNLDHRKWMLTAIETLAGIDINCMSSSDRELYISGLIAMRAAIDSLLGDPTPMSAELQESSTPTPNCFIRSETRMPTDAGRHFVYLGAERSTFSPGFNSERAWKKSLDRARAYCKGLVMQGKCTDYCDRK